jgi:NADPH:quinone reductase-like Zn-dependent oxidoreductase
MKAIVYTRYGSPDVLQFQDVAMPAPAPREVLINLAAASVNPLDFHHMRGHVRLITGPREPKHNILGCDIAGRIEAVGTEVKRFQPGDEVFGAAGFSGGGFAEYVCANEQKLARKPPSVSFESAASVPVAGLTALQGLRDKGRIQPGQKVLIDGASGGVGTFAVQIAKAFGAEVTAVCSTNKVDIARSIGADHVIDYTRENFTRAGNRYDLILGANAFHSLFDYRRVLTNNGTYVGAGGGASLKSALSSLLLAPLLSISGRKKARIFIARINCKDLEFLSSLLDTGALRPVIDRRYKLSETAEAIRYLEQGHAKGKIVLTN